MCTYIYFGLNGEQAPKDTTDVTIDNSVTVINAGVFTKCHESLERVIMYDNVITIENDAFRSCEALEYITFSRNLVQIGNNALLDCHALGAIFLPSSLRTIGNDAFKGCSSLRFLSVPATIEVLGSGIVSDCRELLTDSERSRDDHPMQLSNSDEIHHWLMHRHDDFPLHRVCYSANVTAQDIDACITAHGIQYACTVDDQQMTALHVLSANPQATPEAISACYYANPKAATMLDNDGSIPIHYLCEYNPSLLRNLSWLGREKGCFEVDNLEGFTPLDVLAADDNSGLLPVSVAVKHNIKWGNGMQYVIEENMVAREWNCLVEKDPETGLHTFMLAAVGRDADLSTVFKLLLVNPGLIIR